MITAFSKDLVKRIDMIPFGPPQVQHFGSGNKAGYTLVQLIETSNIVAHFVEETDDMYLDVFSCKEFNPDTVKTIVASYFQPRALSCQVLHRQAPPLPYQDRPSIAGFYPLEGESLPYSPGKLQ